MPTIIILITGLIFSFGGCKKDSLTVNKGVCKPENRPEISDTGNSKIFKKIKGDWQLINSVSFEDKEFLQYQVLEKFLKNSNLGGMPVLKFKDKRKLLSIGPFNQCHFNYHLTSKNGDNWLHANWENTLGCTAKLPPEDIRPWEDNYQSAINNSTCYTLKKDKLVVQYHINEDKKGKLIFQKISCIIEIGCIIEI